MLAFESTDEAVAHRLDADDPLRGFRDRFHIPAGPDGSPSIYFVGNSLGLQPKEVGAAVATELEAWARLGVRGHFEGAHPWYAYHARLAGGMAGLVGARSHEVVAMNGLTVNLHLMMATFYRPTPERHKILVEEPTFPSDRYAVATQIAHHGHDPREALVTVGPRDGEHHVRLEDLEEVLDREGHRIALVMLGGVNFLTGQRFDVERITAAAKARGCRVGLDLAHAAGNVELRLHDWDVDFAAWCGYKYLNGGPGAVAGCFVHERHARDPALPRLGGWWGNDPETRFAMQLQPDFVPVATADGWQLSNPPILALAPLAVSLDVFDEAGMGALVEKSRALTGYLEYLLDRTGGSRIEIITPRDPEARGCQLSILVHDGARALQRALEERGVESDFREPNVVRVAPAPLYNTFHEVWRFARILAA